MTKSEKTENLGKFIKRKRIYHDLSQQALAEIADTSLQYIGEIERGKKVPGYFTLLKIIEALHIDPRDIFPYSIEMDYSSNENKEDLLKRLLRESNELTKEELIIIINLILLLKKKKI